MNDEQLKPLHDLKVNERVGMIPGGKYQMEPESKIWPIVAITKVTKEEIYIGDIRFNRESGMCVNIPEDHNVAPELVRVEVAFRHNLKIKEAQKFLDLKERLKQLNRVSFSLQHAEALRKSFPDNKIKLFLDILMGK